MPDIKRFTFNPLFENTYLVWNDSFCIVIDPGFYRESEKEMFLRFLERNRLRPEAVLLTHGHLDHIYGTKDLQDSFATDVYFSPKDTPIVEENLKAAAIFGLNPPDTGFRWHDIGDGDVLEFGDTAFKVIATPGHTPGGVCFLEENSGILFSGDTLFAGTIGRSDMTGGDYDSEIGSIMEKLMVLDGDIKVMPGHGPSTTIGEERVGNPMLEPFNEPCEEEEPLI